MSVIRQERRRYLILSPRASPIAEQLTVIFAPSTWTPPRQRWSATQRSPQTSSDVSNGNVCCRKRSTNVGAVPSQHQGQIQDAHLEGLVLQNEDARNMSGIETISAGWIICNSWAGIAATFALAIAQGGPVTLIYGPIIMCVLVGACAISLAELASVYPTVSLSTH